MSISISRIIDILKETEGNVSFNQLGFILTVIRDNAMNDEVHDFLNNVLEEIQNKQ